MSLSGGAIAGIVVGSVVVFLILLYLFLRWYTWRRANRISPDVPRVPVNPREYSGKWYEVASYPAWFQADCTNSTAKYTVEGDHLKVVNRCYRYGGWSEAVGRAHKTDHEGVFAVDFFPGIYGNYTVTYRDPDTSIVTNADKDKLWILSRRQEISGQKKTKLLAWLKKHDFDTEKLKFTHQFRHVDPEDE